MLLNVPIPPCYFAQDDDYENEVIDGQQRLYSLYRFVDNQFKLKGLETLVELNGQNFFELDPSLKNRLLGYTLRCVVITNDSDEDLRFDVFERLNSNTKPLNAQELRNCVYRGDIIELCGELAQNDMWLAVFKRRSPDPRMRGEELILRYLSFRLKGLADYRTPQKFWLNDVADEFSTMSEQLHDDLSDEWINALANSIQIHGETCFRRPGTNGRIGPINKALVDLNMLTLRSVESDAVEDIVDQYLEIHDGLLNNQNFNDLISRAADHKSRTTSRFELWNEAMAAIGLNAGI